MESATMVAYKAEQGGERQVAELGLWELLCQAEACLWSSAELRMAAFRPLVCRLWWLQNQELPCVCAKGGDVHA